jgi:hypothetical protein
LESRNALEHDLKRLHVEFVGKDLEVEVEVGVVLVLLLLQLLLHTHLDDGLEEILLRNLVLARDHLLQNFRQH